MLDKVVVIQDNVRADLNYWKSSSYAEFEKSAESLCSKGTMFRLSKSRFSQEFRLIEFPHSVLPSWALFISAVSTTIDSLLKSAGCTVKIGLNSPRSASLAALIKRLHNLFSISGRIAKLWNKLIRYAHLALSSIKGYCGAGSNVYFIAP